MHRWVITLPDINVSFMAAQAVLHQRKSVWFWRQLSVSKLWLWLKNSFREPNAKLDWTQQFGQWQVTVFSQGSDLPLTCFWNTLSSCDTVQNYVYLVLTKTWSISGVSGTFLHLYFSGEGPNNGIDSMHSVFFFYWEKSRNNVLSSIDCTLLFKMRNTQC